MVNGLAWAWSWGTAIAIISAGVLLIIVLFRSVFHRKSKNSIDISTQEHAQNIERVISYTHEKDIVTSSELQKQLGLSNVTIERYLVELQKQGMVKKIGKTGRSIKYKVL